MVNAELSMVNKKGNSQLKKGYKNTEIGVIPEDWELISFDKAFYFLSTASYSRAEISINADIKYVHYGDIHTKLEHFLDFKYFELPTIKNEQLKTYNLIKEGDLIMADASEDYEGIGKSVEVKNIGNDKAISGLHTFLLRGKESVFSNGFKAYLYSNKIIKTQYDKFATGLKVYGVSKGNLKQIQIPLPPLPEQTAIATVLSDTDSLIQALEKKIAKKQLIKKGAMQKLLNPNPDSYREGWEVKTLGEIADVIGGGTPSTFTSEYWNGAINWFTPTEVGDIKYLYNSTRKITQLGLRNCSAQMLPKGSILLTSRAGIGDIGILKEEACTNQGFQSLIVKSENNNEYVYYLMSTLTNVLLQNASGSTFLEISPNKVKSIQVTIPLKSEQTRIAQILSDMDSEIETLQKKLTKYKKLKQGLMQNLLMGKIRLV